ncbi:zinc finger domain-containing protein [Streptomyces mirabilis]|uniref:zinc finger domain-containing protein n=1 Tax=Streptomyces mirabilis TaxID=68239 RepID=UPI00369F5D01
MRLMRAAFQPHRNGKGGPLADAGAEGGEQVACRHWIKRSCPRCHAGLGQNCVIDNQTGASEVRNVSHDDRLQPILEERKAKQGLQTPAPAFVGRV